MTAAVVAAPRIRQRQAFAAVLRRDLFVTWKELPVFLAQVILQPLFLLFVFGKVLASLGYTQNGYSDLLFPGLLALTAVITGMQTLAFPLVVEFGWTKEIEDRLLAPVLGSLLGAGLGLVMGTLVVPQRINIVFSLVFTPLLFTGCSQYPWPSLSKLPWFQVVTACNPMTYVSESMRAALVPSVPHIAVWVCMVVLVGSVSALMGIGVRGFYRRAID